MILKLVLIMSTKKARSERRNSVSVISLSEIIAIDEDRKDAKKKRKQKRQEDGWEDVNTEDAKWEINLPESPSPGAIVFWHKQASFNCGHIFAFSKC